VGASCRGGDRPLRQPMFTRTCRAGQHHVLLDDPEHEFEILVTGQYDGSFPNPDKSAADLAIDPHGFCYLFDDVGDNVYKSYSRPIVCRPGGPKLWQTQYYQTNAMYYNPNVT